MKKKNNHVLKYFFLTLVISFGIIYIAINMGYFEYSNQKKNILTKQQIIEFENDVKNGKDIDIKKYLNKTNDIENTKRSNILKFSDNISKYSRKSVIEIFKLFNKFVEN